MQPKTPLFTSGSQHPPRFGHAVYLVVDPLGGVKCKGQLSTFFTELSHADRGKIIMKHIKCGFRSKASIGSPGWT